MAKASNLKEFIDRIVREAVDDALALSDKRRKEFKKSFQEAGTFKLNLKDKKLKTEADATQPPAPEPATDATAPAPEAPAMDPAGSAAAPAMGDPTAPATGMDPAAGGAPGEDPMAAGEDGEDMGGDAAGGDAGFGGFGGGGGGGGGSGVEAGDIETPEPAEPGLPGADEETGDPISAMVDAAKEMAETTGEPALILKAMKGEIQNKFEVPEHALGLVKALYDTNEPVLQAVAHRLYLFIKSNKQG